MLSTTQLLSPGPLTFHTYKLSLQVSQPDDSEAILLQVLFPTCSMDKIKIHLTPPPHAHMEHFFQHSPSKLCTFKHSHASLYQIP